MDPPTRFRVQIGSLVFEVEGPTSFVEEQLARHREHIDKMLEEQARLIKTGKLPPLSPSGPQRAGPRIIGPLSPRRPGRHPTIIRDSDLVLKPSQLSRLRSVLAGLAGEGRLGKDATVFTIAHHLCREVLDSDRFTAGDVIVVYQQLGGQAGIPDPEDVDVIQMLRNLAAASIGKEWVRRNPDGTFSLTEKGAAAGDAGEIVRPRGRRPNHAPPDNQA